MHTHQRELRESEIQWWPYGYMDPATRTFLHEGIYYRAVKPKAQAYVESLFRSGLMNMLQQHGFIPETEFCEFKISGYTSVLRQETEFFTVPPQQWNPVLVKDTALMYVNMCSLLCDHGFGLVDGHPFNIIIQKNSRPKWCDIGSIVPLENENDLCGLAEFIRHFVYPLLLRSKNQAFGKISRYYLGEGCTDEEANLLLKTVLKVGGKRRTVLNGLLDIIHSIDFPFHKTLWSDYHKEYHGERPNSVLLDLNNQDFKSVHVRDAVLKRIFRLLTPRHVIDYGANAGIQSLLIAQTGAEVLACELDEQAASRCYLNFLNFSDKLRVKVALAPFGAPPAEKVPDLALALALTHHLFFTHHYNFEVMARTLASCTTDILITEFMPNGLGVGKPHISPLPEDYTLEIFTRELGRFFRSIEVVDYIGFEHRKLIIARERISNPPH